MILITGATGHLGKSTIDFLLKELQPEQVAALVRNPEKAEALASKGIKLRQGDYEDYPSLQKAFQGIDQLIFISTSVTGEARNRQHANVVKAAREAGVQHVYYTSILNPSPDATFTASPGHYFTEQSIKEADIPYTFFRNALYMDLIPAITGDAAETETLYFAAGSKQAGFVLREDIAEALSRVVLDSSLKNKIYTISSPQTYSFYDVAVALTKAVNKPIKYVPISTQDMKNAMQEAQVPPHIIDVTTNMADALQKGEFDVPDNTLKKLLGREPVGLETFVQQFYTM